MIWNTELFNACYQLGFQNKIDGIYITQEQWDFIQIVLLTKDNLTFSELEKIKNDESIYLEIKDNQIVEHTKLSIILGIIDNYNKGQEFKNKSKSKK
jgi:hypothetical protein